METRTLGKTGLKVSVLGFGCGAVGGLIDHQTVRRSIETVSNPKLKKSNICATVKADRRTHPSTRERGISPSKSP
jgi:hypothetical protein